jgi:hypothetical protein
MFLHGIDIMLKVIKLKTFSRLGKAMKSCGTIKIMTHHTPHDLCYLTLTLFSINTKKPPESNT